MYEARSARVMACRKGCDPERILRVRYGGVYMAPGIEVLRPWSRIAREMGFILESFIAT